MSDEVDRPIDVDTDAGSPSPLLTPFKMRPFTLKNRIVMAPLTRLRAAPGTCIPTALNAEYYAQRASAGLIIGEATWISPQGYGYINSPGIYVKEQIEGHKLITQAVHDKGGLIALQLWHVGRISHPTVQPDNQLPVAPSAIRPKGKMIDTPTGPQEMVIPRALSLEEIPEVIEAYRQAANNANAAGYDLVELHAANGYLLEEFLCDGSNQREDAYGGSIPNRFRLLREVMEALCEVYGSEQVGVRLSPSSFFNDIYDSNRMALMTYVVEELGKMNLAYLHIVEPRIQGSLDTPEDQLDETLSTAYWRRKWKGCLIGAGGYQQKEAEEVVAKGQCDLIAFGRLYISNPDLPERFAAAARSKGRIAIDASNDVDGGEDGEEEDGLPSFLIPWDRSTFYGGNEVGYTDFPTWEEEKQRRRQQQKG